jgi:hypothetical protein
MATVLTTGAVRPASTVLSRPIERVGDERLAGMLVHRTLTLLSGLLVTKMRPVRPATATAVAPPPTLASTSPRHERSGDAQAACGGNAGGGGNGDMQGGLQSAPNTQEPAHDCSVYRATSSTLTLPAMMWLGCEGSASRASHCCPQAGSHCRLHATSLLVPPGPAGVP